MGHGISYVDLHLLASARLAGVRLYTHAVVANALNKIYTPPLLNTVSVLKYRLYGSPVRGAFPPISINFHGKSQPQQ